MQQEERERIRSTTPDVGEVEIDPADANALAGERRVQPVLLGAPVEVVPPERDEIAEPSGIRSTRPVRLEDPGPAGGGQATVQVLEGIVGRANGEGAGHEGHAGKGTSRG